MTELDQLAKVHDELQALIEQTPDAQVVAEATMLKDTIWRRSVKLNDQTARPANGGTLNGLAMMPLCLELARICDAVNRLEHELDAKRQAQGHEERTP